MVKRKICSLLAAMMITTTILSGNIQAVGATELDGSTIVEMTESQKVADGEYEVNNTTYKIGTEEESSARKYIETKTNVTVKDGKVTMTIKYTTDGLKYITGTLAKVDGVAMNTVTNEDKSVTFEVPSIDSKIELEMTMNIFGFTKVNSIDLVNDIDELIKDDESNAGDNGQNPENPGNDNNNNNTGNEGSNNGGNSSNEEENTLEAGNYTIDNAIYKLGTTEESMARQFIDEKTLVTVKDGKVTMTMKYKGMGLTSIRNTTIKVNGAVVNSVVNEDKSITFEVSSIASKIEVEMDINVESMGFTEVQSVDLVNIADTLTKVDDNNSGNDNGGNTGNEGSNNGSSNEGTTEEGTKVYIGKNEVTYNTDKEFVLNMIRSTLDENVKVEEKDGKYYITLSFTEFGSQNTKDHSVYVNGKKVEATKLVNGNIVSLRFAVGSLADSIEIAAFVDAMGSNVEFGVNILKDTLTLVTDNGTNGDTTGGTTGDSSNQGSTNNGTTTGDTSKEETTTEDEVKVTVGKLYSIQNNVTHESETGRSMARKYLNATSKVEEIEGTYYVTLTFTGSEFMQNHEIYVNGVKVNVTRNTNGDETYIRFAVSSLSDSIKVKTYVVPMSREVEFGVELLEDTLTFIKEYTVETLPNTGAATSSAAVVGLGLLLTSAGTVLAKKRK